MGGRGNLGGVLGGNGEPSEAFGCPSHPKVKEESFVPSRPRMSKKSEKSPKRAELRRVQQELKSEEPKRVEMRRVQMWVWPQVPLGGPSPSKPPCAPGGGGWGGEGRAVA